MNWIDFSKKLIFPLMILASCASHADLAQDLLATWQYDGFFYQNHRYPNPNPELKLTFTFHDDHTARLYWKRDNETGFCERNGTWELKGDSLNQNVTWLNPNNDPVCGKDPDMQLGRSTENKIDIATNAIGTELNLHMQLNGNEFLYILKRQTP